LKLFPLSYLTWLTIQLAQEHVVVYIVTKFGQVYFKTVVIKVISNKL